MPGVENKIKKNAIDLARVLEKQQAAGVLVFELTGLTTIADYFIICSGKNSRHLKALARYAGERIENLGHNIIGEEGEPDSGWVLIDTGDIVVHIFDPDKRELYNLEVLWGDAKELLRG